MVLTGRYILHSSQYFISGKIFPCGIPKDLGGVTGSQAIGRENSYYSVQYPLICWGITPGSISTVRSMNMSVMIWRESPKKKASTSPLMNIQYSQRMLIELMNVKVAIRPRREDLALLREGYPADRPQNRWMVRWERIFRQGIMIRFSISVGKRQILQSGGIDGCGGNGVEWEGKREKRARWGIKQLKAPINDSPIMFQRIVEQSFSPYLIPNCLIIQILLRALMRIPYLYSLLLCLIHLSTSRFYNVNLTDLKNVKLQPHQQIIFSPFAGIFIDRLSLEQVTGNQSLYTTLCQVVPATIKSQVKAVAVFQNTEQSPKILSTFQELKNFKTAIDLILWKGKYYVMFKTGVVEMYGVEEESQELVKLGAVKWGKEVASGYFVSSKNVLLYASSRQLIWVQENGTLIEIKGYGPHDTFIYPYLVNQTVLLIAEESQTITKYVINTGQKTLISKVGIQLPSFLSLDVEDLAYDQYRSIAMILDYTKGVYFLNLHPNNTFSINSKYSINVSSCQNMVFRNDFLYITCPNFYRYSMKNLQLLQQQVPLYPQDLVITEDNQIILKGSSHMIYQRRWQSRPIVFELIEPIRMVFDNKRIVYINNHQLVQESIVIQNDVVKCVPDDSHHPGDYVIHASSTGPCANSLASAVPTTCSYTRNIDVEVWVAHQIYWVIMGIACIILAIGVLISMGWCFVKRTILKRKQREYQILVDENEGYLSAKPEVQLQEQSTNQMNTNKKQEIVTLEE